MRKIIVIFIGLTFLLTFGLIYAHSVCLFEGRYNLISLIGTLYTTLALIFAFLAALWSREAKHIINSYFRDFYSLSVDERNVFIRFAQITRAGGQKLSRSEFLNRIDDIQDAEWYLDELIRKEWITKHNDILSIAKEKIALASQLKGESHG